MAIKITNLENRLVTVYDEGIVSEVIEDISPAIPSIEDLEIRLSDILSTDFFVGDIKRIGYLVPEVESKLPFRVAFKSLNYPGYSPDFPPPIGIAIVGVNNYIL